MQSAASCAGKEEAVSACRGWLHIRRRGDDVGICWLRGVGVLTGLSLRVPAGKKMEKLVWHRRKSLMK